MNLENQATIFSIFHDGIFANFKTNSEDIEFTIEIHYLAQVMHPSFNLFKGVFKNCTKFEYHVWGEENSIIYTLDTLIKLDLEINDAKVVDDHIEIICLTDDNNHGGNLLIKAEDIILSDEDDHIITVNKLTEICKAYWDSFSKL
ncbi:hypothetical protein [Clostridium sp. C8-1-8]|uniref:hypothetical protein n=1 Tax=Clostridium sp. C8-1-8 TaxID=2698831 RepID=UPI0013710020|nr:hypothetical protein [Clostridium sp. C8-1-8]